MVGALLAAAASFGPPKPVVRPFDERWALHAFVGDNDPAGMAGVRLGFFPLRYLGVELAAGAGPREALMLHLRAPLERTFAFGVRVAGSHGYLEESNVPCMFSPLYLCMLSVIDESRPRYTLTWEHAWMASADGCLEWTTGAHVSVTVCGGASYLLNAVPDTCATECALPPCPTRACPRATRTRGHAEIAVGYAF